MKLLILIPLLSLLSATFCQPISNQLFAQDWQPIVVRDKTFSFSLPVKPDEDYDDDTIAFDADDETTEQQWIIVRLPYRGELHPGARREFLRDMFNYDFDPDNGDEILQLEETRLQTHRCMRYALKKGTKTSHQLLVLTKSYFYRFKTIGESDVIDEKSTAHFFASIRLLGKEAIPAIPSTRLWADQSGKFKVEAEFVAFEDNTVALRKKDGSTSNLPIERLSKSDASLVRKMVSAKDTTNKSSTEWILSAQGGWLDFFERDGETVVLPIGTVIDDRHQTLIFSKESNYFDRDFDFEVLISLVAEPAGVCKIGLGDGESQSSVVLMLATPPPSFHKGLVQLANNTGGGQELGRVSDAGTHLLSLRKRKNQVVVSIDVNHDGPSDEDFETVVQDLSLFAPELTNKNSNLFFGGSGIFHSVRLDLDPPALDFEQILARNKPESATTPAPTDIARTESKMKTRPETKTEPDAKTKSDETTKSDAKTKPDSNRTKRNQKSGWPAEFAPSRDIVAVADGIMMKDRIKGVIVTKKSGWIDKDFTMEVVMSLPADPAGVVNIGIGNMESKSTALIMMGTPSPSFHKGLIQVGNNIFGGEELSHIDQTEKRLVRITKRGDEITFTIDVTMDGESDDDVTKTIADVRAFAEGLDKSNSYLFFGGAGIFHEVTLKTN